MADRSWVNCWQTRSTGHPSHLRYSTVTLCPPRVVLPHQVEVTLKTAGSYTELRAWKLGVDLVVEVYRATQDFPKAERYGLMNQLRRAAVSVPSNIAEGKGRFTDREFALFLRHARGSLLEVETQLFIAGKLGYLSSERVHSLASQTEQLAKTLNALLNVVKEKPPKEVSERKHGTGASGVQPLANDHQPSATPQTPKLPGTVTCV